MYWGKSDAVEKQYSSAVFDTANRLSRYHFSVFRTFGDATYNSMTAQTAAPPERSSIIGYAAASQKLPHKKITPPTPTSSI